MKRYVQVFAVCALAMAAAAAPAYAQEFGKLQITAFAVNMSNIGTGGATTVDITVDRWSTAAEREGIIATMVEMKNQDALVKALQKSSVKGRFRIPGLWARIPTNCGLATTSATRGRARCPTAVHALSLGQTATSGSRRRGRSRAPWTTRSP